MNNYSEPIKAYLLAELVKVRKYVKSNLRYLTDDYSSSKSSVWNESDEYIIRHLEAKYSESQAFINAHEVLLEIFNY